MRVALLLVDESKSRVNRRVGVVNLQRLFQPANGLSVIARVIGQRPECHLDRQRARVQTYRPVQFTRRFLVSRGQRQELGELAPRVGALLVELEGELEFAFGRGEVPIVTEVDLSQRQSRVEESILRLER